MAARGKRKDHAANEQAPLGVPSNSNQTAPTSNGASADGTAEPPKAVMPIVAIGASAGGLEALQEFFSKMPADCGMGFVVITHIRPGRESLMPELLAHVTKMQVVATEDDIRVEPNKIIVAKDSLLDISGGVLRHAAMDSTPETMYHPIDHFFRALATDQQEHAICVVLSGSGNDGTLGVKAIKAAGGMVMVQDSGSAKYPSMPDSAQATGLADYALPPGEMPAALVEYCRGPYLKLVPAEAVTLPHDAVQAVLVRLRAHSGQDFTCYKRSTMSRRIERRMNVHHIHEPREYVRFLRENPRELDVLRQELLISVTNFFRDPEAFEALAYKGMAPQLAERQDGCTYRSWIPGCATGEEAYSIAILLHEQLRQAERLCDVQIFATDLDEQAIDNARSGLYPEGIGADVSQQRLSQFFSREDGAYRIHKNIRDMVVFAVQNVVSDAPFTRMDLIVCRNLLIYLDALAQQRVLQAFHYALKAGGLLFLGTSESPGDASRLFDVIDGKNKVLRRKEVSGDVHLALGMPPIPSQGRREKGRERAATDVTPGLQVSRSIERLLLERFAPAAAVVDEQGTIAYVHGRLGQYLEPEQGQPRNNILEMAREGLGPTLVAALREARREGREILHRSVRVRTNGDYTHVDVSVRPLTAPESVRGMLLVTFQPANNPVPPPPQTEQEASQEATARQHMERELQYTRENLQSTIEELQTANEELKSSNEELQSTNEELQSGNEELETSREEMQSLNEELNTVNAELQSKVSALARVNDDMTNLLNSMQVATIFLDRDLKVKRYTNKARDIIRLIESDIGRPLSDLTSSLRYPGLVEDSRQVLASLIPQEREVQDDAGRWYQVRLMPYRTSDNVIDGVVLSLVDISRTKQDEVTARAGRTYFEGIVQTVRQPLIVLDGDLRVVSANEAFYRIFASQADQTEGSLIYDLGDRQWGIPELRQLLEKILPERHIMTDFRVEHDFPGIGRRAFLLNARRLQQEEKEAALILLVFEDVTEGTR